MSQSRIQINLALLTYIWSASSLNYFMSQYYIAKLPGNKFNNFYASAFAEILACFVVGRVQKLVGN